MHQEISVAPGLRAAFIADLHLQPAVDNTYRLALQFFEHFEAYDALFILGDLFEYWIGDDAGLALYEPAVSALRRLSDSGCALTVFLGNRDFLLGRDFADAAGSLLITADETIINLGKSRVLLMHGDTLCTDDHDYLNFRTLVRSLDWQNDFLSLSISERREKAEQLRMQSKAAGSRKSQTIMDVNESEVTHRMNVNNCSTLIHGHTHRPLMHQTSSVPPGTRFVVGDWHDDHAQYALFDGEQLSMQIFRA